MSVPDEAPTGDVQPPDGSPGARGRLAPVAQGVERLESAIAARVPLGPNVLSGLNLFVVAPLILLALRQVDVLPRGPGLLIGLLALFGLLDYLDGLVARERGLETRFGRFLERASDFPLVVALAVLAFAELPVGLLVAKIALDGTMLVLYALGRVSRESRVRSGLSYTVLFGLLALSQGWAQRLVTPELVTALLITNLVFSATVVAAALGILQKRFIADALSFANLTCGCFSMYFAVQQRVDVSLLFLMLGATFDAFDGAAARRWGGTSIGVYSDDVADGVNFGIAPGVALAFIFPGVDGVILGIFYATFTLGRLVFFTLNKDHADPNFFSGVPSPVGALIVMSTLVLLGGERPALTGLLVGVGCMQMVSFDTHYRHLGRVAGRAAARYRNDRRAIVGMPFFLFAFLGGWILGGKEVPLVLLLGACLLYGFAPVAVHFRDVLQLRRAR